MRLLLVRVIGADCADHVLGYIQRPAITKEEEEKHFKRMRDLAEETSLTCLMMATKFIEVKHLSLRSLCETMADRVCMDHMQKHELMVLQKLGWSLNTLTAHQFEDVLCKEVDFTPKDDFKHVLKRAMNISATLYEFQHKNACVIAGIAILAAMARYDPPGVVSHKYTQYRDEVMKACGLCWTDIAAMNDGVALVVRLME